MFLGFQIHPAKVINLKNHKIPRWTGTKSYKNSYFLIKLLFTVGVGGLKMKTKNKNLKVDFTLPPSKYFPSTKAWTPSSSTPTPTNPIPWASNCGLILLKSNAQARHNCHPHRRRKANTIVFELQSEFKWTSCYKIWGKTMQITCNFKHNTFEYISGQKFVISLRSVLAGPKK